MFDSLRHKNYRIFLIGQTISLIGTWVQALATSWLVYSLTKSPFWLGVTGFATHIPTFFFSIISGVYIDHVKKLNILKWTQALALIQALLLAILSYTGHLNIYILIFLNFFLGTINAFDMNARQSFVVHMVPDPKDLPNAIALNSTINNGTRLIGPMMAGIAIASFGETICFIINAISFIAVLVALFLIKVEEPEEVPFKINKTFEKFKEGFIATFKHPSIGFLIIFISTTSFLGMPFSNLFPAMGQFIGRDDSKTLGIMTTCSGVGSLISAIYLARKKSPPDLAFHIAWGGLILGLAIALSLTIKNFYWLLACIFLAGFGVMTQLSATNTMVQTMADHDKRARIISFLLLAMIGIMPFGSLLLGMTGEHFGIKYSLVIFGSLCALSALYFFTKAKHINQDLLKHVARNS